MFLPSTRRFLFHYLLSFILCGSLYGQMLDPLDPTVNHEKSRLWNLRNADIRSVIAEVSRETGKNFLLEPRVQGKITIIASTPMTPQEIYPVFLAALQISGYAAIPSKHLIKIVPNIESTTLNAPLVDKNNAHPDENVVQVIPVKYVSAQQLVPILRPLMPQWSQISAYVPSNMLILSGHAGNLNRLNEIVKRVDVASYDDINMIRLRNASAQEIVKTIKSLQHPQSSGGPSYGVAADERSNAIMITGSKEMRLRLRVLISELDVAIPEGNERDTQIISLHYMQAKDLLPILAGVAKSHYRGPVETIMGTRTIVDLENNDNNNGNSNNNSAGGIALPPPPPLTALPAPTTVNTTASQTNNGNEPPTIEIIGEPNTNSIILNAPQNIMLILKRIIQRIDVRPEQISIEAMIAELTQDDINRLGIRWGSRGKEYNGENFDPTFRPGFGIITADKVSTFEAQIEALANNNQTDVLSTPSVVVMDNHLAHIKVGKEVSIASTAYPNNAGGTTTASPFTTFDRKDAALVLKVTPQVSNDGTIRLNIISENNTVEPLTSRDNPNSPTFNISEISTSVIVNDGDILVFGGLIQSEMRRADEYIPIVGDIPIIGRLFHHVSRTKMKKKLMIFLHPTVLRTEKENYDFSMYKYNEQRRAQLKSLLVYPYDNQINENVLPAFNQVALPTPFSTHRVSDQNKATTNHYFHAVPGSKIKHE